MTITFDEENEYQLLVNGEPFERIDGGQFEVIASRLRSARLSDLPAGCTVVLCDRVLNSRDLVRRSPHGEFEKTLDGRLVAHGEAVFILEDEGDIDSDARDEYFAASMAKGRLALAPFIADGTLLKVQEHIDDEIAHLIYSIQVADQLIPEAQSFMGAIEERIHEGMDRPLMFICHASEDKAFVERLVTALDRRALHAWFDKREILVGDSIVAKINDALKETRYLVPVLSPRSVRKPWVLREMNSSLMRQLSNERIQVLPLLLEDCPIPPLLADIKYADFRTSFDDGLAEMLNAFRR